MNWFRALLATLFVVPFVFVMALGFGQDPHAVPAPLVNQPAPQLVLNDAEGRKVDLSTLRGTPVVLNFWATWCYPCQAEHDLLQEAARAYAGRVAFFGVIYQDEVSRVQNYLTEHPSSYRHLIDERSQAAIDYGVSGVPESYILDRHHRIVHKQPGVLQPAEFRRILEEVLRT